MKFLCLGGDLRTIKLVQMLKEDNHEVCTYGLEKDDICKDLEKIIESDADDGKIGHAEKQQTSKFETIIGPIPFTKDGEKLNAPFSEKEIYIKDLFPMLKEKALIAGPISPKVKEELKKNKTRVIDIMEIEELVIYNTIATAEGAIKIAIENTEINLHGSKILILGFGKVAKALAYKLKGLSAEITCAARRSSDLAWIETLGYEVQDINKLGKNLEKYDIIFNTVPQIILTENEIRCIKKEALIVDLASKPGGVDQEKVKQMGLKYVWALALPGKVAPLASAKYIKQAIYNALNIKT